jgi:ankyrin repeat protein
MINTLTAIKTGDLDVIRQKILTKKIQHGYIYNGASALHLAALYEQPQVIEILIDSGADVNCVSDKEAGKWFNIIEKSTPLHIAVSKGNVDIAEMLIKAKAALTVKNINEDTPLILAISDSSNDPVKLLLRYDAFDVGDKKQILRLFQKAIPKHLENPVLLNLLLEKNLLSAENCESIMPQIYEEAMKLNGTEVLSLLLQYNPLSVNRMDSITEIFLLAVKYDNDFIAHKILSSELISVHQGFSDAKSLLLRSIEHHATKIALILIDYGANVNCGYSKSGASDTENSLHINDKEYCPLLRATVHGNTSVVNTLIVNDASINIEFSSYISNRVWSGGKKGKYIESGHYVKQTVLGTAIEKGYTGIAVSLVKAGANFLYKEYSYSSSVAELTLEKENYELLKVMIENGGLKYFKTCTISGDSKKQKVSKLISEVETEIKIQNKSILKDFLAYFSQDPDSNFFKISDASIELILEYSNVSEQLDPVRFKNYMRYNPVNSDNTIDLSYQTPNLELAGIVSTDDGL